ncbi:MAG: transcription termination factor NusA [Bacteroidales bacterium]|nr:transcription termination factor NusA [Clostridium sp.]MCM1203070.1 transcription termination factor NusA [Bacteroidales bacterium]
MSELMLALEQIEKEKGISRDVIIEAIEKSLLDACKKDFGKSDNITVNMDRETGAIEVYAAKTVVDEVVDEATEISLEKALMISTKHAVGDVVNIEITPKNFGRIAAQQARSVIVQTIKEEEKKALYEHFYCKERDVVTGVVQRYIGRDISISLDDKMDALLKENEQVKSEHYRPTDRIKLYIVEVKETNRGPKVIVSRTHPELVKRLFEKEVTEVADGTVEIKSISREAGSRSKIAVWSNDANVDPVGACVGMNGTRVNNIVDDLRGEKIDIITWSEDPSIFIENALSPSKVVSVKVDEEEKSARVVVPDYQLSLAIGKEGQNARLAARLTGYKIDIKSESQAREAYGYDDYADEYDEYSGDEYDDYGDGYGEDSGYADGYEDDYADENADGYGDDYADEHTDSYSDEDGYSDEYDEYADEEDAEYAGGENTEYDEEEEN